jgi:hypothetical protein
LSQPSSAGRSYLQWNTEQDLHLSLSGVPFTELEFLELVEEFVALDFLAYNLDVNFRTASDIAFQRLTS